MYGPSAHLSWAELACKDAARTPYPHEWRTDRAVKLAREFELLRKAVGLPLTVLSAFRTTEHNRAIGGASHSQHVQGLAIDLRLPEAWTMDAFFAVVRARALREDSDIFGLGRYTGFLHVDCRPAPANGRVTIWKGAYAWTEGKEPAV